MQDRSILETVLLRAKQYFWLVGLVLFSVYFLTYCLGFGYGKIHHVSMFWASCCLTIAGWTRRTSAHPQKTYSLWCLLLHSMNFLYHLNAVQRWVPDLSVFAYDGRLELSLLFYLQMCLGTEIFLLSITNLADLPYRKAVIPCIADAFMFILGWWGFVYESVLLIFLSCACFAHILVYITHCLDVSIQQAFLEEDKRLLLFLKIATYVFWSAIPTIKIIGIFLEPWFAQLFVPMANSISKMWSTFFLVLGTFLTDRQLVELRFANSNETYLNLLHSINYIETSLPMLSQATKVFKNRDDAFDVSFLSSFIQSASPTLKSISRFNSTLLIEVKNNPRESRQVRMLVDRANELLNTLSMISSEAKMTQNSHQICSVPHVLDSTKRWAEKITALVLGEASLLIYFDPEIYGTEFLLPKPKIKTLLRVLILIALENYGGGIIYLGVEYNDTSKNMFFSTRFVQRKLSTRKSFEIEMRHHVCFLVEHLGGDLEIRDGLIKAHVPVSLPSKFVPSRPEFPKNVAVCLESGETQELLSKMFSFQRVTPNQIPNILQKPKNDWLITDASLLPRLSVDLSHKGLRIISFFGENTAIKQQHIYSQSHVTVIPTAVLQAPMILSSHASRVDLKVLLVDDRKINNDIYTVLLTRMNVQRQNITATSSGEAALEKVTSGQFFGLILMDYEMPGMNGLECTKAIRDYEEASGGKQRSRIIICTACEDFSPEWSQMCGGDHYLPKPVSSNLLDIKIGEFF